MERMNLDMSNLNDAQKQALARQMVKMALAKMNPEQRRLFILNMQRMTYKVEINKKLQKHKKVLTILTLSLLPMTYLTSILKVMLLRKIYLKQALALALNLKRLQELASSESRNLISPERKKKAKIRKEDYAS
jgi:hypothetical protein